MSSPKEWQGDTRPRVQIFLIKTWMLERKILARGDTGSECLGLALDLCLELFALCCILEIDTVPHAHADGVAISKRLTSRRKMSKLELQYFLSYLKRRHSSQ